MKYWLDPDTLVYYAGGDPVHGGVLEVPQRPANYFAPVVENGAFVRWEPDAAAFCKACREAIDAHLDAVAQEIDPATGQPRFGSALSAASYAASTNPVWRAGAEAFVAHRDEVWAYAFAELDKVMAGQRQPPDSPEAFVAELPMVEWP